MKWLKHQTNCANDPKMLRLKAEFGHVGYSVYWHILEAIAAEYTKENRSLSLTFPLKTWRKITEISPKKLQNFLEFCEKNEILLSKVNGESLTISCPKLLKYMDEYTKKLPDEIEKTPDTLRSDSGQTPDLVRASPSTSPSPSPRSESYLNTSLEGSNVLPLDLQHIVGGNF